MVIVASQKEQRNGEKVRDEEEGKERKRVSKVATVSSPDVEKSIERLVRETEVMILL